MAVEILMPAISPSMASGKLVRWHVEQGAVVRKGDILAELETDKAALDIEAPQDGVLERILVEGGTPDVPVETPIGLLGDGKSAAPAETSPEAEPEQTAVSNACEAEELEPVRRISPLAARLAREYAVSLEGLRGSGPKGRIVAADIHRAVADAAEMPAPVAEQQSVQVAAPDRTSAQPSVASPVAFTSADPGAAVEPHSVMRRTIAQRLVASKQSVPHFYLETSCDAGAMLALRKNLNDTLAASGATTGITVNDMVMKAYALALARTPEAMVTWTDEGLLRHKTVDLGLAVALDEGLITPILPDVARLSLGALSAVAREAIGKAREGRLAPHEYAGGLAGISNLGMYGVSAFSAIINPPQSMNLAVGAIETALALKDGAPVETRRLRLTLSVDHRAIDGALGARVLQALREQIEAPLLLAV
ncbi:dihydrolipoamide acetyltransferase family protein [Stappia sp.]|uniref:dihydrolipoamide acetyltransferase family protein n=1 Tax=Stappia sp. TaxID=1870903 RepID=UPI003A996FD4